MKRLVVTNGRLLLPEGVVATDLVLICASGKIESIISKEQYQQLEEDEVIDAEGRYVAPGFIDLHVHGGGGHDFMDCTVEAFLGALKAHAKHGTTGLLPTTLTCPDEELFQSFEVYRETEKLNTEGAQMLGMHLEGPYFNPSMAGAQDPKYLVPPRRQHYMDILEKGGDVISRWSAAPELEGSLELAQELKKHGILVSVAHTCAVYEEVAEAYKAGFSHMTHFYSATSTLTRKNARRYAGAVEAAYMHDDVTVEVIADGVHLIKPLLQYVYKFKGPDKTALCTDAMRAAGMPEGESILGSLKKGQPVIVEDGVAKLMDRSAYAGSVATADRLVRTMINIAEVPLTDAVKMLTATPARIMGLQDKKGSLKEGLDADVILFDENIAIDKTIVAGKVIYSAR